MEYLFLNLLKEGFLKRVSRRQALSFGSYLAKILYTKTRAKKVSEENLRFVGFDISIGEKAFENFVRCSVDFLRSENYSFEFLDSIFSFRDESTVSIEELNSLNGGILLTAHIGNWELLGGWFSRVSGGRLSVVAKPMRNRKVDNLINRIRTQLGVKVIPTGKPVEILKDLKKGKFVAILLDQRPTEKEGVLLNFLGRKTYVNKGVAVLSVKTGKPVIPAFCYVEGERYSFEVHRPIYPEGRTVEELTSIYSSWIEKAVIKRPEQWFWIHRRWKNSPEFKRWKENCQLLS